jgi:hypothetical protein
MVFRVYLDLVNGSLAPAMHSFPSFEWQNSHVAEDVVLHLVPFAPREEWRQHHPLRPLKVAQSRASPRIHAFYGLVWSAFAAQ